MARVDFIDATGRAKSSAINEMMRKAITQASKDIRKVYNISAGDLRKKIITRQATKNKPEGRVEIDGRGIPLGKFAPLQKIVKTARGKRVGVTVKVKKSGGRKLVKGGFQALRLKGGSEEQRKKIFKAEGPKRVATKGRYKGKSVEPLMPLFTTSPATMFVKEAENLFLEMIDRELFEKFDSKLDFFLKRQAA
jgi:hypothetical protein